MSRESPLILTLPADGLAERIWVAKAVFGQVLGIQPELRLGPASICQLELRGRPGLITWPDRILPELDARWLEVGSGVYGTRIVSSSFGDLPIHDSDLGNALPKGGPTHLDLGFDLLGSSFLLLSRYEEALPTSTDVYGRFPATATWGGGAYLQRPLVDEWIAMLRGACERCWPNWPAPQPIYSVWLSCDLDHPYADLAMPPRPTWLSETVADLFHRCDPLLAARRLARLVLPGLRDPFDTYAAMDGLARKHGLTWTFTVMQGGRGGPREAAYTLSDPRLRSLLAWLHGRGHNIGLHASFAAGDDPTLVTAELLAVKNVCAELGIHGALGGRHHYLRCHPDHHWPVWDAAGAAWESSLGFSDHVGFRCGTAHSYPAYDLRWRRPLSLLVRPLVAMDQALLASPGGAVQTTTRLAETISRTGGCLSMLWHNSTIAGRRQLCELQGSLQAACTMIKPQTGPGRVKI